MNRIMSSSSISTHPNSSPCFLFTKRHWPEMPPVPQAELLDFEECLSDCPEFRAQLHLHEKLLNSSSSQLKGLINKCDTFLDCFLQLQRAQEEFGKALIDYENPVIGNETKEEQRVRGSVAQIGTLLANIAMEQKEVHDKLKNAISNTLFEFRKIEIKSEIANLRKKHEKQTKAYSSAVEKFCKDSSKPKMTPEELAVMEQNLKKEEEVYRHDGLNYVRSLIDIENKKAWLVPEVCLIFWKTYVHYFHWCCDLSDDHQDYSDSVSICVSKIVEQFKANQETMNNYVQEKYADVVTKNRPRNGSTMSRRGYVYVLKKQKTGIGHTWIKHFAEYWAQDKLLNLIQFNPEVPTKVHTGQQITTHHLASAQMMEGGLSGGSANLTPHSDNNGATPGSISAQLENSSAVNNGISTSDIWHTNTDRVPYEVELAFRRPDPVVSASGDTPKGGSSVLQSSVLSSMAKAGAALPPSLGGSADRRFCFELRCIERDTKKPVQFVLQALGHDDRREWLSTISDNVPVEDHPSMTAARIGLAPVDMANKLAIIGSGDLKSPTGGVPVIGYTINDCGKRFVDACIGSIELYGVETKGLYRIPGQLTKVKAFLDRCLEPHHGNAVTAKSVFESPQYDIRTATSALKSYLRELSEPLTTFQHYDAYIAAGKSDSSRQDVVRSLHKTTHCLPQTNFLLLRLIVEHLAKIADHSEENLMTASDLAICFGPTLLRPRSQTIATINDTKFGNLCVEILIQEHALIFRENPLDSDPFESRIRHAVNKPSPVLLPPSSEDQRRSFQAHHAAGHGDQESQVPGLRRHNAVSQLHNLEARSKPGLTPSSTKHVRATAPSADKVYAEPDDDDDDNANSSRLSSTPPTRPFSITSALNNRKPLLAGAPISPAVGVLAASTAPIVRVIETTPAGSQSSVNQRPTSTRDIPSPGSTTADSVSVTSASSETSSLHGAKPAVSPRKGRSAVALYDCTADDPSELTFYKDDILDDVVSTSGPSGGWLRATRRASGIRGDVPANYVMLLNN